jgi:hypothetical protein
MQQTKAVKSSISHEQQVLDALGHLKVTVTNMGDLRKSLAKLQKGDFSLLPDTRMLKIHTHLRTNGKNPTIACPEIILRGNWLEKAGFNYDDQWVHVITMNELIIITPELKMGSRQRGY